MDKEKFIDWLERKINTLLVETPQKFIDDSETKAYIQGTIKTLDEIKLQVENGKFDK